MTPVRQIPERGSIDETPRPACNSLENQDSENTSASPVRTRSSTRVTEAGSPVPRLRSSMMKDLIAIKEEGDQDKIEIPQVKKIIWPDRDDRTSIHAEQMHWSVNSLPDILYVLKPTSQHAKSRKSIKIASFEIFGKPVREFAVLPRQISSRVEGWRMEAWLRLDRRLTVKDILERIDPKYNISVEQLERRRKFFRDTFHVACWGPIKTTSEISLRLREAGIEPALNTTRGLTPGLIDPSQGEAGGRIPIPVSDTTFFGLDTVRLGCDDSGDTDAGEAPRQPLTRDGSPTPRPSNDITSPRSGTLLGSSVNESESGDTASSTNDENSLTYNYGDEDWELAYHPGAPASGFSPDDEDEQSEHETTLEEYLESNHISYEEYIARDFDITAVSKAVPPKPRTPRPSDIWKIVLDS
ncbi:hypothetical protein ASPZODRAFT_164479 [Penicilliopsis zonata CBS 506.65]|uniref:Uncharacterized protein n=1 Tax=Penicilliopsis zonata CBS 506.65 TaxID=1073090 RepID=A0A1L9SNV4_9EURO|nr:hypothetical protein ASPZODRAFT_164479 [Penicilliopsis zonata CBS 506.65]OJJ48878.1 hypothetical protein ASPZODRAFT_164479 [Penicilliopsis zonata CBS 506.65]